MKREYPTQPLVGVGGVVIHKDHVLLVRRAREPLKGQWSLPGGLVKAGETLRAALRREIAEETGLRVHVGEIIEVLDRITVDRPPDGKPKRVRFHYVLVDFRCQLAAGANASRLRAASDASEVRWVHSRDLPKYHLQTAAVRVITKAFRDWQTKQQAPSGAGRRRVRQPRD
jgi:ADP-ribose pyrophosphatase YjhB (NUDIX family)